MCGVFWLELVEMREDVVIVFFFVEGVRYLCHKVNIDV